ncbi:MAG: methyltransferase domain-containing protein [Deinococcus sp.]|uniref:class I SAM-dependent methyltransferase n=1 Tax=Deinococcus sp. TaxID=47478 RepID=UPI0026DD28EB|nr:class I SAM-dependent methyltransferase [Deinococcus sp.]MDO4244417.1 methyltransferase domain-containing protein [Deinococcus sp.]
MTQHAAAQYGSPDKLQARVETHRRYSQGPELEAAVDSVLGLTGNEALLDLGCGPGVFLARLQQAGHRGRLVGLDLSEGMLTQARMQAPGVEFVQGDAEALPFDEASFDVVTARHMLYHVPDIDVALREAWRVLRPGGLFLAVTNASDYMQEWYVPFNAALSGIRGQHPDAQRFTEKGGPERVEQVFGEVEVNTLDSALVFPQPEDALPYFRSLFDEEVPPGAEQRFLDEVAGRLGPQGWRVPKRVLLLSAKRE